MSGVADMIRLLAGRREITLQICIVDGVDRSARTVDCTPVDEGAPLLGCNLQACQGSRHGIVFYPKVGSYVLVGMLEGLDAGLVLLTDELEELEVKIGERTLHLTADGLIFNGGELGGLVKIEGLTNRLNAIEEDINNLKQVMMNWVPVPNDGGAALKTHAGRWAGSMLEKSRRSHYENDSVKH